MNSQAAALNDRELSRRSFLRGTGMVAAGLSLTGLTARVGRASNNTTAVAASHTGVVPGPPDPTLVDSWLQVNPDNTVTLFHGWTELGQGTPTAVRMIAAEELGLSIDQVTAAQVDTDVSLSAFTVGSTSTPTAFGAASMRGAAAAARTLLDPGANPFRKTLAVAHAAFEIPEERPVVLQQDVERSRRLVRKGFRGGHRASISSDRQV